MQIERGTLAIFIGDFEMIQNPEVAEKALHRGEVLWKLNGNDSRAIGFDFGALDRVVIDEDETVETKVEFLSQRSEVFGFRNPVEAAGCKILTLEQHLVETEDFFDVFRVVLAAKAKKHAGIQLRAHEFVQDAARFVDLYAGWAILAANSAPKSIVAIERDHFARRAFERMEFTGDHCSKRGEESGRIGNVAEAFALWVVVLRNRINAEQFRSGHQMDTRNGRESDNQAILGCIQEVAKRCF